ncbi:MAG: T9SS type A sorting domain-containing protein [Ferruginibacter sp.]|nr:T9SS type A sorting domain-containing protein [Chitinophagaceae bacterium]
MKKKFLHSVFLLFVLSFLVVCPDSKAQGIYQLWGTTPYGGPDNEGVLFSTKYDATGFTLKKNFTVSNPGHGEQYNKPVVYNNKLYSLLSYGGTGGHGIITEYDPANNTWTKKTDLFSAGMTSSDGHLMVYNSKLYGLSNSGGTNGAGAIFEFNPATNSLLKLYSFPSVGTAGYYPQGSLVIYNSKFYGVAHGGVNDNGVIFQFDPGTNVYTKKVDFEEFTTGKYPHSGLVAYNGKLWGTTSYGGLADGGTLFSFDPDDNSFSKKKDLESVNLALVNSKLTVLNNKLYGSAFRKGASGVFGGILEYDPAGNVLINKYDYEYSVAHFNIEFTAYNNKLYSNSSTGGLGNEGVVFSYDPVADFYQHLEHLEAYGLQRGSGSLVLYDNKMYGFALHSGDYSKGALFSFDPVTTVFTDLIHLGGPELVNPTGPVLYYNNKMYGTTTYGGAANNGGIYEYNPVTGGFIIKFSFPADVQTSIDQGGVVVYNNKFYGVTRNGGAFNAGTLYEYDPATNIFSKKHEFVDATGSWPQGNLAIYNGKLYGTCVTGSTNTYGNIFEYNPATGVYAEKVIFNQGWGGFVRGKLTLFNNKFYGLCGAGGANSMGTVFEYNPLGNSFAKKADFAGTNGSFPRGSLTEFGGKLYGTTFEGGAKDSGVIFQYDPAATTITKKVDLDHLTGKWPLNSLTLLGNKFYGMMNVGGQSDEGATFQYDPVLNNFTKRTDFNYLNGSRPLGNDLFAVPALTAPGSPGSCTNTQTVNITAANANEWIPYTDAEGRAVAEINANGNILGNTAVRVFVNGGNIRQNGNGVFYLDRNITITPTTQPNTPVSIRLYIRKSEFDNLKATVGSGVASPADLTIFKNTDFCTATMNAAATPLQTVKNDWATDYVYSTEVSSFSSFYFAKNSGTLPVHLLSFTGKQEGVVNQLNWTATCTNDAKFTVERSSDGINFNPIGTVTATQQDCNHPFTYQDAGVADASYYYRLKMEENNGPVTQSKIIFLNRSKGTHLQIKFVPNPVTGPTARLQVESSKQQNVRISISDMTGRLVVQKTIQAQAGSIMIELDVSRLGSGTYNLNYITAENVQTVRFIKQ